MQQTLANDYQAATKRSVHPSQSRESGRQMIILDGNLSESSSSSWTSVDNHNHYPMILSILLAVSSYSSAHIFSDLNNLVLNFLILEGYESAAKKFAAEANLTPRIPTDSIHERVEIRSSIIRGEITQAIHQINDLNPEVRATICRCRVRRPTRLRVMIRHAPLSQRELNDEYKLFSLQSDAKRG